MSEVGEQSGGQHHDIEGRRTMQNYWRIEGKGPDRASFGLFLQEQGADEESAKDKEHVSEMP